MKHYVLGVLLLSLGPSGEAQAGGQRVDFRPTIYCRGMNVPAKIERPTNAPRIMNRELSESEWVIWVEQCLCRVRLQNLEAFDGKNIVCSFSVGKTGSPSDLKLEKTSGSRSADEQLLALISKAGPFPTHSSQRLLVEFSDLPKVKVRLAQPVAVCPPLGRLRVVM